MSQHLSMIIAGATGLVGKATLNCALGNKTIRHVYSLSRRPIEIEHKKLTQWLDPALNPLAINSISQIPRVGLISLGSTLKKAGSKMKLRVIDVELVIKVAKDMQLLGVQHIIVVSCIGASIKAGSHYLRCKGEMEMAIEQLDFERITFLQPGPLAGPREEKRNDEKLLQWLMKIISPLMLGRLANYKPIESRDMAETIMHLATEQDDIKAKRVNRFNSSQMLALIR